MGFRALILPAISLGLLSAAGFMRLTRSGMIDVMNTDFIRTARAKGLNERTVIVRHALRHAMIPVATILGIELGTLIAGSVIIEVVFSWPGLGRLMIESIIKSDYPTVQAGVAVIAFSIAMGNLVVDISYRYIDPRIQNGGASDGCRTDRRSPRSNRAAVGGFGGRATWRAPRWSLRPC